MEVTAVKNEKGLLSNTKIPLLQHKLYILNSNKILEKQTKYFCY